jgi:hypothetical protein
MIRSLPALGASLLLWHGSAAAQAVVGYQQQLSAGWQFSTRTAETLRERRSLGVAGSNVQPLGGGSAFSLRNQWELREQGRPFSLRITDVNPEIRLDQSDSRFQSVSVQRFDSMDAAPTGVLGQLLPDLNPPAAARLSVFTDP